MKIGLVPVNVGVPNVEAMVAIAQKAEAVGLESVWTFEHVLVPLDYSSAYPYSADGKMAITPDINLVDPLIALATVAAHTEKLRLGTGVNVLTQANPLYLAKQAASLDFASNGRFMLGVGIGWLKEEFAALGIPFERRGARFDDYVVAMRKVWSGDVVEHESDFLHWHGWKAKPLPVQRPGVPIVVGGVKGKVFERVAKYGDGWFAPSASFAQLEPRMKELGDVCRAFGREPKSVEVSCMWNPGREGADVVEKYRALGVSRLIVPVQVLGPNPLDGLDKLANGILAKLR